MRLCRAYFFLVLAFLAWATTPLLVLAAGDDDVPLPGSQELPDLAPQMPAPDPAVDQDVPQHLQQMNGAQAVSSPGLRPGSSRFHINDGFYFHRQRVSGGRTFLRCVNSRSYPACPVRAIMSNDMSGFYISHGEHNHAPDEWHERVQQLRDSLMQACRARPNVRVEVIYHEVCRNVPRDVSSRVSLLSIRPSMIRAQAEYRPNIPHSFLELDNVLNNNVELRQTVDGEELVYRGVTGNEGHRSMLFMSGRVVDGVGPVNFLFLDATFYSRPNSPNSAQLFTIVTMRDNHVIPLAHALMESRTEAAYRDLFTFFRRATPNLDPEFLVTDFETALQQGLRAAFPRSRLVGCLWHYARAICRNVRTLGLHELVRDVENARRIVRLSLGIPLAPANRLQEAVNTVVIEARRIGLFEQFEQFFHYLRTTWVVGVGAQSLSVFGVRYRTNNAAETHHRNLNARLVRRPNIWRFLELITETEDTAWRDLGRIEVGLGPSRARRTSSIMNDARVRSLSRQIMHGEMDMLQFLSSVSWHLDGTMRDLLVEREDPDRPPSPERCPALPVHDPAAIVSSPNPGRNPPNRMCPLSDADFQNQIFEPIVQPSEDYGAYQSVDRANDFEDLMEDIENRPAVRGRGTRGRRGRGRPGRGPGRGRGKAASVVPPRLPNSQASVPLPPPAPRDPPALPAPSAPRAPSVPRLSLLRPRPQQHFDASRFRSEEFSDEELMPEIAEQQDEEENEERRWQECLICNARVGHYTILGCGVFPICGFCIRQWFVRQGQRNCPHCASPTPGWVRLRFD